MKFEHIFKTNKKEEYIKLIKILSDNIQQMVLENAEAFKYLDIWWGKFLTNLESEADEFLRYAKYQAQHPEKDKLKLLQWWDEIIATDYYEGNVEYFFERHGTKDICAILHDRGLVTIILGVFLPRTPVGRLHTWDKTSILGYYKTLYMYYKKLKDEYLRVVGILNEV